MGAKIILVVEKDTAFQRRQQEFQSYVEELGEYGDSQGFNPLQDILLVTGKGNPDFSTRLNAYFNLLTNIFKYNAINEQTYYFVSIFTGSFNFMVLPLPRCF